MIWVLFIALILGLLFLDLGVFHKKVHAISMKESILWTMIFISLALLFGIAVFFIYKYNFLEINKNNASPGDAMLKYFTGYVIEESLSLDNIFVIALIFSFFKIEKKFQHNILFWEYLGQSFFRGIMILLGTAFIERFHWSTYVFGAILIYSAISMMTARHDNVDYSKSFAIRLLSKLYPIKWDHRFSKYFIKENGKIYITASFATLMVIEFTDILFAVDSIPAILAVTPIHSLYLLRIFLLSLAYGIYIFSWQI
jgi:tellurite resistance protein TerC